MHQPAFAHEVPGSQLIEVRRVPFRVKSVLRVVWTAATGVTASRGVQLDVLDETEGLLAVGDPVRLRRALLHLVTVAMHETDQRYLRLRATCKERNDRCAVLRFLVDHAAGHQRAESGFRRLALPRQANPGSNTQDSLPYVAVSPRSTIEWMGGHVGIDDGGNAWFDVRVWRCRQDGLT